MGWGIRTPVYQRCFNVLPLDDDPYGIPSGVEPLYRFKRRGANVTLIGIFGCGGGIRTTLMRSPAYETGEITSSLLRE